MEVAIVRSVAERRADVPRRLVATLRYALSFARIENLPTPDGVVALDGALDAYHAQVVEMLEPELGHHTGIVDWQSLAGVAPAICELTEQTRAQILLRFANRIDDVALEREIRHKALVVVAGGGGGSGYVYVGGFKLLDDLGYVPSLIVGTSIGSVIGIFRARRRDLDFHEVMGIAGSMTWGDVFQRPVMRRNYGLPASLRLYLRSSIAQHFRHAEEDRVLWIREMEIPLRVIVAGISPGRLAHDMDHYEHLMDDVVGRAQAAGRVPLGAIRRQVKRLTQVFGELVGPQGRLKQIVLGADELTSRFDVVDAAGFSSSVPGLIHYDIVRDDPHMHALMKRLFRKCGITGLVDGGVVSNVPSRIAWEQVQKGVIGTRNAFVLAMDCFAPQMTRNVVALPIQRLVRPQVSANAPYAGLTKRFRHVLSPLDLVPEPRKLDLAVRNGYQELAHERRFIVEMMRPIDSPFGPCRRD